MKLLDETHTLFIIMHLLYLITPCLTTRIQLYS